MEELLIRIESAFNLKGSNEIVVGFEQNLYLKGLHHFTEIFNSIEYKQVLQIKYQGYKQGKPVLIILHPYFLNNIIVVGFYLVTMKHLINYQI